MIAASAHGGLYGRGVGFDGFILVAILTLFFAYLLPTVIRSAQVSREARVDDRFSAELRIVARAGEPVPPPRTHQTRTPLHPIREAPMEPPVAYKLIAADARRVAAARAARAAAASRRAAAARRRLLLSSVLGALTVLAWALVATTSVSVGVAIVPTVVTAAVVELGRRAAAAGRSADAALAEAVRRAEQRSVSAAVRAATPKLRVDVDPASLLPEPEARTVVTSAASPEADRESKPWTPVPVPPPAYTLKQAAPRRVPSARLIDDASGRPQARPSDAETEFMPAVPSEPLTDRQLAAARAEREAALVEPAPEHEPEATTGSNLNVQEILARRRAVG